MNYYYCPICDRLVRRDHDHYNLGPRPIPDDNGNGEPPFGFTGD